MWMNSLGLGDDFYINNLFEDCKDGLALLKAIDKKYEAMRYAIATIDIETQIVEDFEFVTPPVGVVDDEFLGTVINKEVIIKITPNFSSR